MPKENTHIFLVKGIIDTIRSDTTRKLMRSNYDCLCLGSIVADTFFYSSSKDIVEISEKLHGKEGERTNELTFHLLDRAKSSRSDNLLCMALGYISHCVFDMIFHPVIYYLVGNYYDDNPSKRESAVYRHRLIETRLDSDLNNKHHLHDILRGDDPKLHEILAIFAERYNVSNDELIKAFKKQVRGNRCFKSPLTYKLIYLLNKYKIINCSLILPLFYGHLETDKLQLKQTIDYRDIVDGHARQESLQDLLESARVEAITRIDAAVSYYEGNLDRAAAIRVIRGESLDTGREDCPVTRINHTINHVIN